MVSSRHKTQKRSLQSRVSYQLYFAASMTFMELDLEKVFVSLEQRQRPSLRLRKFSAGEPGLMGTATRPLIFVNPPSPVFTNPSATAAEPQQIKKSRSFSRNRRMCLSNWQHNTRFEFSRLDSILSFEFSRLGTESQVNKFPVTQMSIRAKCSANVLLVVSLEGINDAYFCQDSRAARAALSRYWLHLVVDKKLFCLEKARRYFSVLMEPPSPWLCSSLPKKRIKGFVSMMILEKAQLMTLKSRANKRSWQGKYSYQRCLSQ